MAAANMAIPAAATNLLFAQYQLLTPHHVKFGRRSGRTIGHYMVSGEL
jgi:hypothetical protein